MNRPSFLRRLLQSKWSWRVLLASLLLVVSWLALTPSPPSDVDTGWDKLNHAMAFAALMVAAIFSGRRSQGRLLAAMLLLLAFGGAIELLQLQVPGRDADLADLLADGVGMAIGLTTSLLARLALGTVDRTG